MNSIKEALGLIKAQVGLGKTEQIPLSHAVSRTLASDISTDIDSPPHDKSVMDGFAVKASDVKNGVQLNVLETIVAGSVPTVPVSSGTASRIMTGAPLPEGADAVVMIEQTEFDSMNDSVVIELDSLRSGHHVMNRASAMAKGDTVFSAGHVIRPQDIGLLAECGAAAVKVYAEPTIAILPTGDELVSCDQFPGPGMIRNSNGPMLMSLARAESSLVTDLGVGRDDRDALEEKVIEGLQHDFLILSGGVSAGLLDLVPEILTKQNVVEVFHKVAIKPGKPIWFGVRESENRRQFVFGLPGNPVSSLVGFNVFVRAALAIQRGFAAEQPCRYFSAELGADHEIRGNRVTFWPMKIEENGLKRIATPITWRGSSDLQALGHANGLGAFSPADASNFRKGETVKVMSLV